MGKHNIAFCRNIAVGIPGGGAVEHRKFSEQDFCREFCGVEDDRHPNNYYGHNSSFCRRSIFTQTLDI